MGQSALQDRDLSCMLWSSLQGSPLCSSQHRSGLRQFSWTDAISALNDVNLLDLSAVFIMTKLEGKIFQLVHHDSTVLKRRALHGDHRKADLKVEMQACHSGSEFGSGNQEVACDVMKPRGSASGPIPSITHIQGSDFNCRSLQSSVATRFTSKTTHVVLKQGHMQPSASSHLDLGGHVVRPLVQAQVSQICCDQIGSQCPEGRRSWHQPSLASIVLHMPNPKPVDVISSSKSALKFGESVRVSVTQ